MRNLTIIGVLLIALGIGGMVFDHVSFTEDKPVLDAGPIHVEVEKEHRVSIPTIAGVALLVAGLGLVIVSISRRSA